MKNSPITVFYSWQSDLPRDTNQNAIRNCIGLAIKSIQNKNKSINLILDEATRNEAGSPEIPSTIFKKISNADIFICDVTTINSNDSFPRKTPNPNILIELGFAIAILGWERIIMVFNNSFGIFNTELPFDLEKRKVLIFNIENKLDNDGKRVLKDKLETTLITIIEKKPQKSIELINKRNTIKWKKDIKSIKVLLSCIHVSKIDLFINELPSKFNLNVINLWESFIYFYDNSAFHIYDNTLNEKVLNFRNSWNKIISFKDIFYSFSENNNQVLELSFEEFPDQKTQDDYHELVIETKRFKELFKDLMSYINETYLEIDLNKSTLQ